MKKVLLINGSPNEHGCTDDALQEASASLNENGIETEILWLGKQPMQDCISCFQCQQKGKCVFEDQVNETAARLDEFGRIIAGSPVYYGGPNGRLTSFLDRLFFSSDGTKFRGMLAASVVSCRRGGATAAFERLNQYFLIQICMWFPLSTGIRSTALQRKRQNRTWKACRPCVRSAQTWHIC